MPDRIKRSEEDRRNDFCQRMPEDCPAHSGQDEKLIALQSTISTRLNLMIWLLGIGISAGSLVGGTIYARVSTRLDNQDTLLTLINERQSHVIEWIGKADQRLDGYEKGIYNLQGYDEGLKHPKGRNK